MTKEADIVVNPASHFDGPVDLANSDHVAHDVKHAALSTWEQHAAALDVAAEEGMVPAPHEAPLRPELEAALGIVAAKAANDAGHASDTLAAGASDLANSTTAQMPLTPGNPAHTTDKKEDTDMTYQDKKDKIASDVNQTGDDIGNLARAAIESIRKATEDFAARAGVSKGEAIDAVRNAGQAAMNSFGTVAGEARAVTESGLDSIGKQVVRNPLAALAIAAGAGLLLGLLSRSDTRR